MQDRAGIGLVGAGGFGEFCLDAFSAMPDARIVAVADVQRDRAERFAARFDAKSCGDLDALLRDPRVEIVALNTPPYLHAPQGLAVLNAGKHLFCEKPLALTLDDARRMIARATERQLLLTVNYVMRHNPFWQAAAELRRSGVLGDLRHLDLMNHAAGLALPAAHWFWDDSKSGGIWIEHGVHFFDAFAWVSGHVGRVSSSQKFRRADGAIDRVEALLQYGSASAHCYHAFDQSPQTEQTAVRMTFEHAYVTLREWVPTSIELRTKVPAELWRAMLPGQVECQAQANGRIRARSMGAGTKPEIYRRSVQAGMLDLINGVRSRSSLRVTGAEALASLETAIDATRLATVGLPA